jgi:hypothetical protein
MLSKCENKEPQTFQESTGRAVEVRGQGASILILLYHALTLYILNNVVVQIKKHARQQRP